MAINESATISNAISKLTAKGFGTSHPEWKGDDMVEAIVEAVFEEIKANADVIVTGGSSSGTYKIT